MRFTGRVAIITGSAGGIGRATASRLASEGASVVVNYRTGKAAAREAVATIESAGGVAYAVGADVATTEGANGLVDATIERFGRVDILVANAGAFFTRAVMETTDEDLERALDANLRAGFRCIRAVLPTMVASGYGRIVAITSVVAERGDVGTTAFAACAAGKGATVAMLRPIASEVAPHGITVNAVSPGFVATDMMNEVDDHGQAAATALIPKGRFARPEEIASAVAYLASDEAGYITGQTLRVNGGMVM